MTTHVPAATHEVRGRAKWGDRDARDKDIREAARRVLARDGLAKMNMRAVAKEAQVAPGTVYTYFASKESLYAELYADRLEELAVDLTEACSTARTAEEIFKVLTLMYLDVYATFGRELDVWSMLAGIDDRSTDRSAIDPTTVRLIEAAITCFAAALNQLERIEPDLASALQANDQLGVQLLWVSVSGLAEHFNSSRRLLHDNSPDKVIDLGIRVLVAGIRSELAALPNPSNTSAS